MLFVRALCVFCVCAHAGFMHLLCKHMIEPGLNESMCGCFDVKVKQRVNAVVRSADPENFLSQI